MRLDPKMTRASIANIETGRQRILAHTLVALADALACDVADLLPSSEPKRANTSGRVAAELHKKLGLDLDDAQKLATRLEEARRS